LLDGPGLRCVLLPTHAFDEELPELGAHGSLQESPLGRLAKVDCGQQHVSPSVGFEDLVINKAGVPLYVCVLQVRQEDHIEGVEPRVLLIGQAISPSACEHLGDNCLEVVVQVGPKHEVGVRIGDDVDIGANTTIDRGAIEDTVLEDGVKLDNLVQIGHNVRIGAHTVMAGCVGVAGSAVIGAHCMIGGAANILGHLEIADNVQISVATVVTRSIAKPGLYSGSFPFDDNASWEKYAATLRQLHALRERLRALEKRSA